MAKASQTSKLNWLLHSIKHTFQCTTLQRNPLSDLKPSPSEMAFVTLKGGYFTLLIIVATSWLMQGNRRGEQSYVTSKNISFLLFMYLYIIHNIYACIHELLLFKGYKPSSSSEKRSKFCDFDFASDSDSDSTAPVGHGPM